MDDFHIALWQTPHPASTAEAVLRLDAACAQARAHGAELLVTPEMFMTGYAIGADRVAALAEPADGPLAQAVATMAQRHGMGIVYGYPEQNADGKPFNAAQAIGPDGKRWMNTRKTHLFGDLDRAQFSAGDAASQVFEWRGWQLGLLICYDVEFPEAVRGLTLQGADAVLVPTANMEPFDEVQRVLLPARALENTLYLAYANACGGEGTLAYNGLSCAIGPDGGVQSLADKGERLLIARLDATALQHRRLHSQRPGRRPDLYKPLTRA